MKFLQQDGCLSNLKEGIMPRDQKRMPFRKVNKYQRQIIVLAFFPAIIVYAFVAILIVLMHRDMVNVIVYGSAASSAQFIYQWTTVILSLLCGILVLILVWAFLVSRNLVGAFGRITRELDQMLEKGERWKLKSRKNDHLVNDILRRVNALIFDKK